MVKRLTPVLFVNEIEPSLKFWVDRLGFKKIAEVPEGSKLGFVILEKDNVQVMYQTFASLEKDMPGIVAQTRDSKTFLYLEVADLDVVLPKLKGADVYLPERKTFYGMREIGVREPGGHYVTFAAPAEGSAH